MKYSIILIFCSLLWLATLLPYVPATAQVAKLSVSPNKRYLLKDGKPFFYLSDTGWEILMRLNREEADEYLKNRADKGFNVIMAMLLGELPNMNDTNAYGDPPLIDKDPTRPNESYFKHADYIIDKANSLGMFVAIAPSWGNWMYREVGRGPHPFNTKNARSFGEYVGRRYKDNAIIWIIGGDNYPGGYDDILRAMAEGLDEGDEDRDFLMTFHGVKSGQLMPPEFVYNERLCSAHLFGDDQWLDFHGAYSGHYWAYPTYTLVTQDRAMKPTRPVIDLEPCYEDHPYFADGSKYYMHPEKWDGKTRGTAALIREQAYWAMLAGAAGHTYGNNNIWQFYYSKRGMVDRHIKTHANTHWRKAMDFPGAAQMGIMRRLFESRPWQEMEPDQRIIVSGQGSGENHIQAAVASDNSFLFCYLPRGGNLTIDMTKLSGSNATAYWFNPRNGDTIKIGKFACHGTQDFSSPSHGVDNDWVLVVDDATRNFPIIK